MCGIVAYLGPKSVESVLLVGLTRLEYRGYDSAGMAVLIEKEIELRKSIGKIRKLAEVLAKSPLYGKIGIAHTRWATHGEVNWTNAHPHTDTDNKIAVVHNGIIENHSELRKELLRQNHIFRSETDTEVIPHLMAQYIREGIDTVQAFYKVISRLKGSYSIVMLTEHYPDAIFFARDGASLVVGQGKEENGEQEYFLASDKPAMTSLADGSFIVENRSWGYVSQREGLQLFDYQCKPLTFEFKKIVLSDNHYFGKGEYDHYMLKEIHEQVQIVQKIIDMRLQDDDSIHFDELHMPDEHLINLKRVITISAGTSWHAALIGKMYMEHFARIFVEVDLASEFRYNNPILMGDTQVLALSQSGETADTLAGVYLAKSKFLPVLTFVNNLESTIARESDWAIDLHAGLEIGVASTKAYTAQLVNLLLYALYVAGKKQIIDFRTVKSLIDGLRGLPAAISQILARKEEIRQVAEQLARAKDVIFLARAWNHSTALEGALKLKEISYIHASGYAAGEFKHGPIALISEGMPVICIANHEDSVYTKMISNIEEVRSRKGKIIAIVSEGDEKITQMVDLYFAIPRCPAAISPILNIIPLQLFAYYVAIARGCEPDQPRNLAKSVTVE